MKRLALAALLAIPSPLAAQTGLLVVAHGASPDWNARVRETVTQVQWTGPVRLAFLMGPEADTAGWDAGVTRLVEAGATNVVIVPLFVSSAGAHYHQIRHYAGEIDSLPAQLAAHDHRQGTAPAVPMRVSPALDGAPELGLVLNDLWTGLAPDDRRGALVFVAHGPSSDEDADRWVSDLTRVAAPVAERAGIPLAIGLLRDDAPPPVRARAVGDLRTRIEELARRTADSVTVLPLLVSRGTINTRTIPRDLAGLPVRYVPVSLAPSPHLARWIERVALATLATSR